MNKMDKFEKHLYLDGEDGLKPYLRLKNNGMPKDKLNQIAWLLLNGGGCGFCAVCMDEYPCHKKEEQCCTEYIADYIRKCVNESNKCNSQEGGEQK